jgi:hypothetical protein
VIASNQPGDVEHFRPKNRVTDDQFRPVKAVYPDLGETNHMGYFWLAYEWENLLPSCTDCNRYRKQSGGPGSGKLDRFPIEGTRVHLPDQDLGAEKPLLVNPTETDPNEHFTFFRDGTIGAKTNAGQKTLELLGLNTRESLVRERQREYASAERVLADFISAARGNDLAEIERLRCEVNDTFKGTFRHTAFSRLAFSEFQAKWAARTGGTFPIPIREMQA